jgi:hypothetical protein
MQRELASAARPPAFEPSGPRPPEGPGSAAGAQPRLARGADAREAEAAEKGGEEVSAASGIGPGPSPRTGAEPPREEALPGDLARRLDELLQEVRAISRELLYERSSIWNVFGGIAQVFALGVLALAAARWEGAEKGAPLLILALLLQVMALTFFVNGK